MKQAPRFKATSILATVVLAACGAETTQQAVHSGAPRYPGTCSLVAIDEVAAPSDQDNDSVGLVARYRFGEAAAASHSAPLSLQFQIARARKHDLRQYLEAHSTVVCHPDTNPGEEAARVEVPPFEGQSGRPVP
jgi:hypothetical protein